MTSALTRTQTMNQLRNSYLPSMPRINLQQSARNLTTIAVPMIALAAFSNAPTADGWFGSNPRLYVECFNGCDRIAEDVMKLMCYTACWIFS